MRAWPTLSPRKTRSSRSSRTERNQPSCYTFAAKLLNLPRGVMLSSHRPISHVTSFVLIAITTGWLIFPPIASAQNIEAGLTNWTDLDPEMAWVVSSRTRSLSS